MSETIPVHSLNKAEARRLLVQHHFKPAQDTKSPHEVLTRLGSVQFDPLKPVGCNHDLVLQARLSDYRVDDWQHLAYEERFLLDGWDKQASLVLMQDWPCRRIFHSWHGRRWQPVLDDHPESTRIVLQELKERGPLNSTAFEHQPHNKDWEGSWYGPKVTKNILRALWHTGRIVTHSRQANKHVYDLTERLLPAELLEQTCPQDSVDWLILMRHQAVGLLRPNASQEVWSLFVSAKERKARIQQLVERSKLVAIEVEGQRFHALPESLQDFDAGQPTAPIMRFIAPLDQLMWDRKAVAQLFDFEYLWEVYKPEKDRRWGYYVLPVLFADEMVARIDSRFKDGVWQILRWYWEIQPEVRHFEALEGATRQFMRYLNAERLSLPRGLDHRTREVFKVAQKSGTSR